MTSSNGGEAASLSAIVHPLYVKADASLIVVPFNVFLGVGGPSESFVKNVKLYSRG